MVNDEAFSEWADESLALAEEFLPGYDDGSMPVGVVIDGPVTHEVAFVDIPQAVIDEQIERWKETLDYLKDR